MRTMTLNNPSARENPMQEPEIVYREMRQYLTLTSGNRGLTDQEELEWPLLLVAQEIRELLLLRGVQWEIPLFERIVSTDPENVGRDVPKLLIPLPELISWNDYDAVIKRALKRRKDFWVVQIRFERITEGKCLQIVHKGYHAAIPATVRKLKQFAETQQMTLSASCHEIYLNDAEETPHHHLQTLILIPVKAT